MNILVGRKESVIRDILDQLGRGYGFEFTDARAADAFTDEEIKSFDLVALEPNEIDAFVRRYNQVIPDGKIYHIYVSSASDEILLPQTQAVYVGANGGEASYSGVTVLHNISELSTFISTGKPRLECAAELEEYVMENYRRYDAELCSLHFNVEVSMPKAEIVGAYADIQDAVNGDEVVTKEPDGTNGTSFDAIGTDIYTGCCRDFLESLNDRDGLCRFSDGEQLDFIL